LTTFVGQPGPAAPPHAIDRLVRRLAGLRGDAMTDRVRTQQIDLLFKNVGPGVIGAGLACLVLEAILLRIGAVEIGKAASWAAYMLSCVASHLLLLYRYRTTRFDERRWRSWAFWFTLISFAEGLGWGWATVYLDASGRADARILILAVSLIVAAGTVPAFASYLPAFFALFVPASLPFMIALFADREDVLRYIALMIPVYAVAIPVLAVQMSSKFQELVVLRLKSGELAENLRSQIELVEQAMIAKSNFLAAASHDLRQPVHAIALFAGALRELPLPEAGRRLTGQIENSVVALDGLFAALLDISRLDAQSVEVRRSVFAITPLIARIAQDFAAEAVAKGVKIEFVASRARVYADPILLERILRNLVSNALRYTPEGRVLVGCRRRPLGVEIQVCDTGVGIAPAHREVIFKEYFQLNNPERDREKGLGLGLAIVQRLVRLLDAPLSLRSQLGRGSCFGVLVPLAGSAPFPSLPEPALPTPRGSGLIAVIDDEAPILMGMATLLEGWGYDVVAAASGEAAVSELSQRPVRPDLVISDHWLRGGETGFDVIDRVRVEYNDDIPAILISGDTGPALLADAEAGDVVLLHKPTHHGKLRAAIAHSLAARRPEGKAQ